MTERPKELAADVVRTRRLVMEDEQGHETAYISLEKRPGGGDDVPYFRIGCMPDEAFFEISMQRDGAPALRFNDRHGRTRILIEVNEDDVAGLTVMDAAGTPRARIVVTADGLPSIVVDQGARIIRQRFGKPETPSA